MPETAEQEEEGAWVPGGWLCGASKPTRTSPGHCSMFSVHGIDKNIYEASKGTEKEEKTEQILEGCLTPGSFSRTGFFPKMHVQTRFMQDYEYTQVALITCKGN